MYTHKDYLKVLAKLMIVIVFIMSSDGYSKDPNVLLEKNLSEIVAKDRGGGTDIKKLEDDCLSLLSDNNSPEEKGIIYSKIALMYAGKGYSSPNDIRIQKTTEYSMKALGHPLDVVTSSKIYACLADSQIAPYWHSSHTEFIKARREAILTILSGIKLVLENNAPKYIKEPPPPVGKYEVDSTSPDYEKVVKKHDEQMAARKKWEFEQNLYFQRDILTGLCVSLYSHKPYNTGELENFAREKLKGHDDAIDEIMAKVQERIQQRSKYKLD